MNDWHETFFEGDWLYVQRNLHPPETSDRQAAHVFDLLGLRPGQRVLDAPCGNGRIAVPLARRGLEVTGVDLSGVLLEEAVRDAGDLPATFVRADLRALDFDAEFDVAVNWWGSFGYFDEEGDRAFADGLRRALVPGGRLVVDLQVAETLLPAYHARGWMRAGDAHALEERRYDPLTARVESDWTFFREGRESRRHSSIRIYTVRELAALLADVGFSSFDVRDSGGGPFVVGSRLLLIATA